jgi:hypothetical protein
VDGDVPELDGRRALAGEADAADVLRVFENGVIVRADWTELEHTF